MGSGREPGGDPALPVLQGLRGSRRVLPTAQVGVQEPKIKDRRRGPMAYSLLLLLLLLAAPKGICPLSAWRLP